MKINNKEDKLITHLKRLIKDDAEIKLLVSKITLSAIYEIKNELKNANKIQIILESIFRNKSIDREELLYEINHDERDFFSSKYELKSKNNLLDSYISKFFYDLLSKKSEIRGGANLIDSKFLLIEDKNDSSKFVIDNVEELSMPYLGMSNGKKKRYKIDLMENDEKEYQEFLIEFEEIWNSEDVSDIKEEFLEKLKRVYKENEPEKIYTMILFYLFREKELSLNEANDEVRVKKLKETKIWNMLYDFQKDSVVEIISNLKKFNGCILADSVGLGKTFQALAVIKYYLSNNKNVLVLCPKRLNENWSIYSRKNDRTNILSEDNMNFDVLNHSDLTREKGFSGNINLESFYKENYDLIVIDESHNFKNGSYRNDRRTRYEILMEDFIKDGVNTQVLMLSATPVNISIKDIYNQISLITQGNDHFFNEAGLKDIKKICNQAQFSYLNWAKKDQEERTPDSFYESIGPDYTNLIQKLTIARSKKQVIKYYKTNITFPAHKPLIETRSDLLINKDIELKSLYKQIGELKLCYLNSLSYVFEEYQSQYDEKYGGKDKGGQKAREKNLISLNRITLLKRLESSIYSFIMTLNKYKERSLELLSKIDLNSNLSFSKDGDYDENDEDEIEFSKMVKIDINHLDTIKYKQDIELDIEKLNKIIEQFDSIDDINIFSQNDKKIKDLKLIIDNKIKNNINKGNKKVIVFSFYSDTTKYLYSSLSKYYENQGIYSALITGGGSKTNHPELLKEKDMNKILTNFSPISKKREMFKITEGNIDIVFATDCVSEGQNLQDCDFLINYDIHWNPIKIIQRFGRIDRIGSLNQEIQMVNFWPNINLDEYLNLETRVKARASLASLTTSGEENILDVKNKAELKIRHEQIKSIRNSDIDLDELGSDISLSDITISEFIGDLKKNLFSKKIFNSNSPLGSFSITSKNVVNDSISFLIKENGNQKTKTDNPNWPYYLITLNLDGELLYSYKNYSRTLQLLKDSCFENNQIDEISYSKFYKETKNGKNMAKYSSLLNKAIKVIVNDKDEEEGKNIFTKGLAFSQNSYNDFILISFVLLKGQNNGN